MSRKEKPSKQLTVDSLEVILRSVVVEEKLTVDTLISKLKSGDAGAVGVEKMLCLSLSRALLEKALEVEPSELSHILKDVLGTDVVEILGDAGIERVTQTITTKIHRVGEKVKFDLSRLNALPDVSAEMTGTRLLLRVPENLKDTTSIQEILSTLLGAKSEAPSMQIFKPELLQGKKIRYEGIGFDIAVEMYSEATLLRERRIADILKLGWHLPRFNESVFLTVSLSIL